MTYTDSHNSVEFDMGLRELKTLATIMDSLVICGAADNQADSLEDHIAALTETGTKMRDKISTLYALHRVLEPVQQAA
jgi:hypothetical protein